MALWVLHLKSRKAATWLGSRRGWPWGRPGMDVSAPYRRSLITGSGARTSAPSGVSKEDPLQRGVHSYVAAQDRQTGSPALLNLMVQWYDTSMSSGGRCFRHSEA